MAPHASTSRTPVSTAGVNWPGMVPPLTSSANAKAAPRARLDVLEDFGELTAAAAVLR